MLVAYVINNGLVGIKLIQSVIRKNILKENYLIRKLKEFPYLIKKEVWKKMIGATARKKVFNKIFY